MDSTWDSDHSLLCVTGASLRDCATQSKVCRSQLEELVGKAYPHYEALETELIAMIKLRRKTIQQLQEAAKEHTAELDKHHKRANRRKLAGSTLGIVGGVINVVGLALIPVTLGVSTVVSAAGAGVAAVGGAVTAGTNIAEFIITESRLKEVRKAIAADTRQLKEVHKLWNGFKDISKKIGNKIDEAEAPPGKLREMWRKFKKWVSKMKMCWPVKVALFCWDCFSGIKSAIYRGGVALYDVGIAVLRGLEECGKPGGFMKFIIRCIGLTTVRVFDGLFTAIGLAVDVGTFICTAYDIAKGSHSGAAIQLRETISKLQDEEECWSAAFLNGYDPDVVSATSGCGETNWDHIIRVCRHTRNPFFTHQAVMASVLKRVKHSHADVQLDALTLLDVCVSNCGKDFQLELNNPSFLSDARAILAGPNSDPRVTQQLKGLLMSWAAEFKNDSKMKSLLLYTEQLCSDDISLAVLQQPAANKSQSSSTSGATAKEEEDIEKAIRLSLQESQSHSTPSLYPSTPSVSQLPPVPKLSTRTALVVEDFVAADENELSIRAGEVITVVDDSGDWMWWGESSVGQGEFPASFVTSMDPEYSIQQSLLKSQSHFSTPSLYPSMPAMSQTPPAQKLSTGRARVIYDFLGGEASELSLRAGEVITVVDNSGDSWWWVESRIGQGLFPASFVS